MEKLLREILFELNRIKRLLRTVASNTEQIIGNQNKIYSCKTVITIDINTSLCQSEIKRLVSDSCFSNCNSNDVV